MNITDLNSVKSVENPIILQETKAITQEDVPNSIGNIEKGDSKEKGNIKKTNWDLNELEKAVNNANNMVESFNRHLNFSIDEATERIVVKVIDDNTGEVIRQIPPEEMLKLAAHFVKIQALLFNGTY